MSATVKCRKSEIRSAVANENCGAWSVRAVPRGHTTSLLLIALVAITLVDELQAGGRHTLTRDEAIAAMGRTASSRIGPRHSAERGRLPSGIEGRHQALERRTFHVATV